jgi:protein farnesyltransferase subunit beta
MPDLSWSAWPSVETEQVFDEEDRVGLMHPIYNIPSEAADNMKKYFESREGF